VGQHGTVAVARAHDPHLDGSSLIYNEVDVYLRDLLI
jgi:hypothetical protein